MLISIPGYLNLKASNDLFYSEPNGETEDHPRPMPQPVSPHPRPVPVPPFPSGVINREKD